MLVSLATPAQKKRGSVSRPRQPEIVVSSIDIEGFKTLITQPRQHPLLVNFWATYCIPCREEIPALNALQSELQAQGLKIVGASLDDSIEGVNAYQEEVAKFEY